MAYSGERTTHSPADFPALEIDLKEHTSTSNSDNYLTESFCFPFRVQNVPLSTSASSCTSRASSMSDSSVCSDNVNVPHLKSTSSGWDIDFLDKLGIIYRNDFVASPIDILNLVHGQTGLFSPLTEKQKTYVKALQDHINYSFSINDIVGIDIPQDIVSIVEDELMPAIKKDMVQMKNVLKDPEISSDEFIFLMVEDFIRSTKQMIQHQLAVKTRCCSFKVPELVFVDLFKVFVKMCGLVPYPGQYLRSAMRIMHQNVTSESDIVIMTDDQSYSTCLTRPDVISVVTIGEVNNLCSFNSDERQDETKSIQIKEDSTNTRERSEPAILSQIKGKVLAQHGGELLLHNGLYKRQLTIDRRLLKYNPGIILIGTKVYFTLMELNLLHVEEIETYDVIKEHKSYIQYSEPKDLLKKEDRDVLIEAFVRLKN